MLISSRDEVQKYMYRKKIIRIIIGENTEKRK